MNKRLRQFLITFEDRQIDAFLVTDDRDIRYLTGYPSCESWLFVSQKKAVYLTDFRYMDEAKKGLKGIPVFILQTSLIEAASACAKKMNVQRLGFNPHRVSYAQYKKLNKLCRPWVKLIPCESSVDTLRQIKDEKELALVRKAVGYNLELFQYIRSRIRPGRSERSVLNSMQDFIKHRKIGFSFDPIVASGPHSSYPHARVTDRRLRRDEIVLIDVGIDVGGYKSDLTRMFFLGKISRHIRELNEIIRDAQKASIEKIKPGRPACEIDQEARNFFKRKRLDKYFGHSLGHGVGLDIHEKPVISSKNSSPLKKGMIFTIEPALYFPGRFGIRIEDMVVVTSKGCRLLSKS